MNFTWRRSIAACALLLTLACAEGPPTSQRPAVDSPYGDYLGRYRLNEDLVLVVSERDGLLTLLPSFWQTTLILEAVEGDRFRSRLYPEVKFAFHRGAEGRVSELEVSGAEQIAGTASRLSPSERLPVEALLAGHPDEALSLLERVDEMNSDRALGLANQLLNNFPSRDATAARFLDGIAQRFPDLAEAQEARGVAWVSAGDRQRAAAAFRRAVELDENASWPRIALGHLDPDFAQPEAEGWQTPFSLADLFRPPTAEEIRQVRQRWLGRDLSPKQVRVVEKSTLHTEPGAFQQRVVSHLVHGDLHYAAVLVPAGATPGCCPVILDVKGISWGYHPKRVRLPFGTGTVAFLGDEASRFVFAVPGLRGEVLEVDGDAYLSEGDRTDGWDGAADDTIALLSAVLEAVPEADPERAGVFGVSRGASVALLAAARDPRINCVSAWAGPADWFRLTGTMGWTLEEQVSDGMRHQWQPGQGSGSAAQFIEWFLRNPIDRGEPSLAAVRARVAASSPLFFVDTLPPTDLQYGVEDRTVVITNGIAMRDRLDELGRSAPDYQVTFHEGAGHRMPYPWAYDRTREFFLRHLIDPASE